MVLLVLYICEDPDKIRIQIQINWNRDPGIQDTDKINWIRNPGYEPGGLGIPELP